MSKAIAQILGEPEHKVAKAIAGLESKTGYSSVDVRLLAANAQLSRQKIESLGLDPDDTTGAELYHALLAKYQNDSQALDRALQVNAGASFDERLAKARQLVEHLGLTAEVWALKNVTAKKISAGQPPKKLMKHLRYRTVASFIKRETMAEAYLAAAYFELPSWQATLAKRITKLPSTDFAMRTPQIVNLAPKRYGSIKGPKQLVATNNAVGAVGLWPSAATQSASVLSLTLLLIKGLSQLNPSKEVLNLVHVHPALGWWTDAEHLAHNPDGRPISLHIHDVALNHMHANIHGEHLAENLAGHFWQKLLGQYDKVAQSLISEAEPAIPIYTNQTAPEYAEAN